MSSMLSLVLAFVSTATVATAQQPSATAWAPMIQDADAGVDLRVQFQPSPGGWLVAFQNRGTRALAFGYYLEGPQTRDALPDNGRIRLEAGESTSWIQVRTSSVTVSRLVPAYLRFDDDTGPFWRE